MDYYVTYPASLSAATVGLSFYLEDKLIYRVKGKRGPYNNIIPENFTIFNKKKETCCTGCVLSNRHNMHAYKIVFMNFPENELIVQSDSSGFGAFRFKYQGEYLLLNVYKRKYCFSFGGWDFNITYGFFSFKTKSRISSQLDNLDFPIAILYLITLYMEYYNT